jgi:hypothetical protein
VVWEVFGVVEEGVCVLEAVSFAVEDVKAN